MTSIPLFVQYFIKPYFRATSPDHNGNASLDKPALMPPLPPWLTRSSGNDASPPQDLSQDEPKDFSPRSRHFSSNSNGEFSFFCLTVNPMCNKMSVLTPICFVGLSTYLIQQTFAFLA